MSIAAAHANGAADRLRIAIPIADPYLREEAIWEAAERVRLAAHRLWGSRAEVCEEIAGRLEEGCEAGREPPPARILYGYARRLERLFAR